MTEDLRIKAAYYLEQVEIKNWALDGLGPDTVSNLLATGAVWPDVEIHFIGLTVSYNL